MRTSSVVSAVFLAVAVAGCGDSGSSSNNDLSVAKPDLTVLGDMAVTPPDMVPGFMQPAGTVAISFTADDTANKVFTQGDLKWKGSMTYNETTRIATFDGGWAGGDYTKYAPLYDDGPWNAGGHEPAGAKAGDHVWGVTVFATPPAMGTESWEYGIIDSYYEKNFGNGWLWPPGDNGKFTVKAGDTAAIKASGITFSAFGTTDMQLKIDTTKLDTCSGQCTWDTSAIGIKGSAWSWGVIKLSNPTNGVYTFTLSDISGAGKMFPHTGLLNKGDKPEWIFVVGAGNGKEYKDPNNVALKTGVTAGLGPKGGPYTDTTINIAGNNNTTITVP